MTERVKSPTLVQSLDRGLELLEAVAAHPSGLSLADLAEFLEVSQPAAFNLASTLVHRGYLVKTTRPVRYRLGRTVMDLTRSYLASGGSETYEQVVTDLISRVERGVAVVVEQHAGSFMYTLRGDALRPRLLQRGMQHIPGPYNMASTLCLLAYLDADERAAVEASYPFHELGAAFWTSHGELEQYLETVRSTGHVHLTSRGPWRVAAPVFNAVGDVTCALGMSVPDIDPPPAEVLAGLKQEVLLAAQRLSQAP